MNEEKAGKCPVFQSLVVSKRAQLFHRRTFIAKNGSASEERSRGRFFPSLCAILSFSLSFGNLEKFALILPFPSFKVSHTFN